MGYWYLYSKEESRKCYLPAFSFLFETAPTVFLDMDFTVATPLGAFGWESSPERMGARVAPLSQLSLKAVDVH